MKRWISLLVILAVIAAGLVLTKNYIMEVALEQKIKFATGLKTDIGDVDFRMFFDHEIYVTDLRIFHPPGFEDGVMFTVPEMYIRYNPQTAFDKVKEIDELRVHLKKMEIVRNELNELNVDSLKFMSRKKKTNADMLRRVSGKKNKDLFVRKCTLRIEDVRFRDFTREPPRRDEWTINVIQNYEIIQSVEQLGRLMLIQAVTGSGIQGAVDVDIESVKRPVKDILLRSRDGRPGR